MSNSDQKDSTDKAKGSLFFSFGFKLMLVMTLIVAGVSVTAVLVIEKQINRSYRYFLNEQFSQEIERFRQSQVSRTEKIREGIISAAGAVRPLAAITGSGDPKHIYTDLGYELEPLMESYRPENASPTNTVFFRFFNTDGKLVVDDVRRNTMFVDESAKFEPLVQMASRDNTDVSGYLVLEHGETHQLYEIIITPIEDDYTGNKLGYILFGLPVSLDDRLDGGKNQSIESQFHVDGYFFPENLAATWREQLRPFLNPDKQVDPTTPEVQLDSQAYLLFTHNISPGGSFPPALQLSLYSLKELNSLLNNVHFLMLVLLPVSLVIAIALSALASRRISQRVLTLAKGTQAIRQGDLKVRMPNMGRDEIGVLADSFNHMAEDLELKEKYRNVLDLVTERSVAEELLNGTIELGGELRQATMLFCDIRGFTPLTDGMDPQEVVSLVNAHMTAMTKVAHEWNGVIDKFVGDEIMVLFGVPQARDGDIVNAVRCGLGMIAERKRLNETTTKRPIQIGIGIATGQVVAGCMGSEKRLNYSVLGDRVNLAARLCSKAAAGEVITDERTVEALPAEAKFERMDRVALKGFANQVSVYRIESTP